MNKIDELSLEEFQKKILSQEMHRIRNYSISFPISRDYNPQEKYLERYKQQLIVTNIGTNQQWSIVYYIRGTKMQTGFAVRIESDCCYDDQTFFNFNALMDHLDTCTKKEDEEKNG